MYKNLTKEEVEEFDIDFGLDEEYLKTLPAEIPKEDVAKLIDEIKLHFDQLIGKRMEEARGRITEMEHLADQVAAFAHPDTRTIVRSVCLQALQSLTNKE